MRKFALEGARIVFRSTLVAATVLAGASSAIAQPTAADRTLAETLFEQGRKLMESGSYAEACPKLAESQKLDPATGTLLNLAACHEKQGQTATAWTEFKDAASLARRDGREDRVQVALQHAAALEPALSRVTISVSAAAAAQGVEVKFDDAVVGRPAWGVAMPADPGSHQVRVTAAGKKPWSTTVEVGAKNDSKQVTVAALEGEQAVGAGSSASGGQSSTTGETGKSSKAAAYVIGGLGIVSLGVGSVFGLQAISKSNDAKDACAGTCTQSDVDKMSQAKTAAWISNVGIGLGVVGIGVGAYLLFKPEQATHEVGTTHVIPLVGSTGGGVLVQRSW
jgi:hypothetical protein